MGSDIVERLQIRGRYHGCDSDGDLYREAATEIERLRSERAAEGAGRAIRHEDGHPHGSHRWVGGGEYGSHPPTMCGDCGVDIEDDEALDPCSPVGTPPAPSGAEAEPHTTALVAYIAPDWREAVARGDHIAGVCGQPPDRTGRWERVEIRPAPEDHDV